MIGQTLSHYRIVEKIGVGGVGVVYRAHDEQLDRDVAIKVLRPGSLADEAARKRFRKEALSLARLNHPNIATIHEFGSENDLDFLVTEYIAGMTLDAKLAAGALPAPDVFRLGLQLAQGLSAAHSQGIVHRDLKPGNLRLTTDGRLKILDFGLAQLMPQASDQGLTVTLTQSQEVTGTLPYMAPEQLRGEAPDARSDVWSAGAVLYEMATGQRPFVEKNSALLINSILNKTVEHAAQINPAVPAVLDEVIRKALAKDPSQRYQTAGELAVGLELQTSTGSVLSPPPKPAGQSHSRPMVIVGAAAALAIVIAAGLGGYVLTHRKKETAVSTPAQRRRSIAVLGFKNLSGNPEKSWLSTALSELMTTELSQGDQMRTIPGESVSQMRASLALPDADSYSQQTLTRIRQNLGSDDVVVGSFLPLGDGLLRLDLRLQDTAAGETLASVSEKGSESEIDSLVSKAGAELRAKLGMAALSDEQSAAVRTSLPSKPEAARLYAEGIEKLRLFDALAARDLLEKAVAIDPGYAPAHSALAQAWLTLGYDAKAKDQARRALELSSKSSGEERLLIEARAHETLADGPAAVESYHALWQFFPDRVDYGLFLIRAQVSAGRGSDAEATLAELRKLPVSEAEGARIDLADANIAMSQSDFKRQQSSAERAANQGRAVGASLLVAEALQVEANASERLGQSDKSLQLAAQARELYSSAGHRQGAARTLLMDADVLFDQGDFEGSRKKIEAALVVFQQLGAGKSTRGSFERLGNISYQQGKLQDAEKYYDRALKFDQSVNDPASLASDYGNIANALDGLGDLTGSLKMQQQSLAAFNQIGDRRGSSATLNNLGNLSVEMGNLEDAKKYFDQALALATEISYAGGQPYPMSGLGDVLTARGELGAARKRYEQALKLCQELKIEDFAAQTQTALAFVALADGRFSDSEGLAREAATTFDKINSTASSAVAHALLARGLLAQSKLQEASAAATVAVTLSRQSGGQTPLFEATLADARVKAKSGKGTDAHRELEAMAAAARKFGYRIYDYQARLALAEIELWSGSPDARAHLASLEADARARGVLLFANQARALQQTK
ncbi:MAG TPA: tetratricopeptide repeat protein [Terriglobales bacterium]|nr:tetratricopeptide repeat protein [Terriglobales bacterium]